MGRRISRQGVGGIAYGWHERAKRRNGSEKVKGGTGEQARRGGTGRGNYQQSILKQQYGSLLL